MIPIPYRHIALAVGFVFVFFFKSLLGGTNSFILELIVVLEFSIS